MSVMVGVKYFGLKVIKRGTGERLTALGFAYLPLFCRTRRSMTASQSLSHTYCVGKGESFSNATEGAFNSAKARWPLDPNVPLRANCRS